jgi:RNA polymerase sigma-70 factor, ECF subfamily
MPKMLDIRNPVSMWHKQPTQNQVQGGHLLAKAKSEDAAACDQPSSHIIKAVFRFVYSQVNSYRDAEKLTETTFFMVLGSRSKRKQPDSTSLSQLFQVARKLLNDPQQDKPATRNITSQCDGEISHLQADSNNTRQLNTEQETLRQALHTLEVDHQTVLISRFISGLTIQETAQLMGRKSDSVLLLQHQALNALNQILD